MTSRLSRRALFVGSALLLAACSSETSPEISTGAGGSTHGAGGAGAGGGSAAGGNGSGAACGDGTCGTVESCGACPADCGACPPGADHPALFFTDLTSGPSTGGQDDLGAFVTIYGDGFGPERGSSTVTLGGVEVAKYVSWGENTGVARNLDTIVFQPGPGATSGDLVVTVDGHASNPLPFEIRSGTIHFVIPADPNASDDNPGTFAAPYATIYRSAGEVAAGDIVYVKGGTFDSADPRYPGWDCALCIFLDNDPSGTPAAPVAWIGYPGDPPELGAPAPLRRGLFIDAAVESYVVANMRFTGYGGPLELWGNGHRIVGNHAHDGIYSNGGVVGIGGDSAHYRVYGNRLSNNGEAGDKLNGSGFYLQGFGTNQDIDLGWNQVDGQKGARSIQVYGHLDGDRVEDVLIHDNLLTGAELNNIVLGGSDGATNILGKVDVYNNVIVGSGDPGLRINDPEGTVNVFHNVLYDNGSPGLAGSTAQLYVERAGVGRVTVRNNVFFAVGAESYVTNDAVDGDAVIVASNNLFFGADGCPAWDASCVSADPSFEDAAALDFRLGASSPAIDQGTDTGIARDYLGVGRPQGAAYDIGAFEHAP